MSKILKRNGVFVRELRDDEDYIPQHGESVGPGGFMFMDGQSGFPREGALHQPGSLIMTDDQRQAKVQSHDAYDTWLSSAWKTPEATPAMANDIQASDHAATVEDAYARHDKELADAWRHA